MVIPFLVFIFNASVGVVDDVLMSDGQFLQGSCAACRRCCCQPSVSLHGRLLVYICLATPVMLQLYTEQC